MNKLPGFGRYLKEKTYQIISFMAGCFSFSSFSAIGSLALQPELLLRFGEHTKMIKGENIPNPFGE